MNFEEDLSFIIGYLDQSIKMGYYPEKIPEILLFLSKEIKKISDETSEIRSKNRDDR